MAATPREIEVTSAFVSVDKDTGSATVLCKADGDLQQLYLRGDVLLLLKDRILKELAEKQNGGLYMLPPVLGSNGVRASMGRLQLSFLLENGLEARLPIQETALLKLKNALVKWFAEQDEE